MESNKVTVRFNVGGTKYEVAKSLIEMYPNTMLARLISEKWEGNSDPTKEIFIDRDGVRFRCVLDYMRDQKAYLPLAVAKPSVLQDLAYFGFENVPDDAIDGTHATPVAVSHMAVEQRNILKENIASIFYEIVAYECSTRYISTGSLHITLKRGDPGNPTFNMAPRIEEWNDTLFGECLAKFGLRSCYEPYTYNDNVSLELSILESK